MSLLEPEEIEVKTLNKSTKKFIISKLPAVAARKIITQYPVSATPKVGNYADNEELMLLLMSYVGVPMAQGEPLQLTTMALIDNHVPDGETLMRIEFAMLTKNTSFFQDGKVSTLLNGFAQKLQASILKMLTDFSQQSSLKK